MIVCDNCNVCVTKRVFCSDKCRVQSFRNSKPKLVKEVKAIAIPIKELKLPEENLCEHGAKPTDCNRSFCKNYASWK